MPNITFDKSTVERVKAKAGVYSALNKRPRVVRLIDVIVPVIESAFREYAKAHKGCTLEMETKEWKRFLGKLEKHL